MVSGVEKTHGSSGWLHIAQEQDRLRALGDLEGAALWRSVGDRFSQLTEARQPGAES